MDATPTTPLPRWLAWGVPLAFLSAAASLSLWVVPRSSDPELLARALTVDLTVCVPGLAWWFLVRGRGWPWLAVIPAFVLGCAVASWTLPATQQSWLGMIQLLLIPIEIGVAVVLVRAARKLNARVRTGAERDFLTRVREAARQTLDVRRVADVLATEIAVFYYAFWWRRSRADSVGAGTEFSTDRKGDYATVLVAFFCAIVIETIAVHFLVARWSEGVAWALTALSVYSLIWLWGDYRAMLARPIRVVGDRVFLRLGWRVELDVPVQQVASIQPWSAELVTDKSSYLSLVAFGEPQLLLTLREPQASEGMYGWSRPVKRVGLTVDDSDRFVELFQPGS